MSPDGCAVSGENINKLSRTEVGWGIGRDRLCRNLFNRLKMDAGATNLDLDYAKIEEYSNSKNQHHNNLRMKLERERSRERALERESCRERDGGTNLQYKPQMLTPTLTGVNTTIIYDMDISTVGQRETTFQRISQSARLFIITPSLIISIR